MTPEPLSVVVLVSDANPARVDDAVELVRYCDRCRRWGRRGSTHICGENWSDHLAPVLTDVAVERRGGR